MTELSGELTNFRMQLDVYNAIPAPPRNHIKAYGLPGHGMISRKHCQTMMTIAIGIARIKEGSFKAVTTICECGYVGAMELGGIHILKQYIYNIYTRNIYICVCICVYMYKSKYIYIYISDI